MNRLTGWFGEIKAAFFMWLWLRSGSYHRFHDIILPSKNGTAQIDHLIISIYGIFIVETKNKKGWIFGSEDQATWTQSVYGKNYPFQNPLRQAYRQKRVLSEFLQLPQSTIHTVVYFVGDCSFKTPMPDNVIQSRVSRYIKRYRDQIFSSQEVYNLVDTIDLYLSESTLTSSDHLKSLRKRHQSKTTCPKCGSKLVERTAKQRSNAGNKFLGCVAFPKCRFTKDCS